MNVGECRAEFGARVAADQQKTPRSELAVIGHADRGAQQFLQLHRIGTRLAELARWHRAALIENVEGHASGKMETRTRVYQPPADDRGRFAAARLTVSARFR